MNTRSTWTEENLKVLGAQGMEKLVETNAEKLGITHQEQGGKSDKEVALW